MVPDLPKHKTTVLIEEDLWKKLLQFTIQKHGTAKKTSVEIEEAIEYYLNSKNSKE